MSDKVITIEPQQARDELAAARERVTRSLHAVESSLKPLGDWREVVRRHPWACTGAAFFAGYLVGQLFSLNRRGGE